MQTQTLIKDTATVARVTQLAEGDAYRRLIPKESYSEPQIALGIVTGVLNNGETVALTVLELTKSRYSTDGEIKQKVFEADNSLALFPVDADEVKNILAEAERTADRSVETNRKALREAEEKAGELRRVSSMIVSATQDQVENRTGGRAIADEQSPEDYLNS